MKQLMRNQEVQSTREKILLEAVILFAERGYSAVSVRDIAKKVNIKASSMYNHFKNKEELFNVIVDTIQDIYLQFYDRLEIKMQNATNFEQVLEYLFAELKEIYNLFVFYGVSLIATEQYRNEKARYAYNDVYMKIGIEYSKNKFNECIEKKWVKKFDTEAVAVFFMNNILVGSLMITHEDMKHNMVYRAKKMFTSLEIYMLNSVEIIK